MATGKSRSRRTGAGGTLSATTIMMIFLALSGLVVWLLTSNPFAPLQLPYRTATESPEMMDSGGASSMTEPHPVHEDALEELHGGTTKSADTDAEKDEASGASLGGEASIEKVEKQEKPPEKQNEVAESRDNVVTTEEKLDQGNGALESDAATEKLQGAAESGDEHEKQLALETQTAEESTVSQEQEVDQKKQEKEQEVGVEKGSDNSESEHLISDEDQQKRIEIQQKKENEQIREDPHGATSAEQIQHDDALTDSTGENIGSQEKEEPIQQTDPQEITQDSVDEKRRKGNLAETEQTPKKESNEEASAFPNAEIPKESVESKKTWNTQAHQSENEKERRMAAPQETVTKNTGYSWLLCNETAGADFIPCLDNEKDIAKLQSRMHYEHRERHCPKNPPTCLVPLPAGYKKPVPWPKSRDQIWYSNVPHTLLAEVKGHQNWVKVSGEYLTFPGGGTQFIHGALHYIDFIQQALPDIAWGKHTRVVLDVGCGVASFGGYLFDRDVITLSFAPKDEHEAQVQFALERGIPAISAVMGTQRLPFPSGVFEAVHCARCRVPWHADGGRLLLELNRVLRPGGYFIWSATPVYQNLEEDVKIWKEMSNLTVAMCWELVTIKKDKLNSIGAAIYQKPDSNDCYNKRKRKQPPMCKEDDDPDAAWYVPLQACMHKVPMQENKRGSQWPEEWPERLHTPPFWLSKTQKGIYGKPAPDDFASDYKHWKHVVSKSYMNGLGINWKNVRNAMDMRAVYGGFAAAMKDLKIWVMNVVNVDSPDTLPIIYERGLFGIYHDWCESFSTYPRTYDLLHADHLFSKLQKRCNLRAVMAEVDRIVRPGGKLIARDESGAINDLEELLKSLHWEVFLSITQNQEGILSAQKSEWRPDSHAPSSPRK